MNAGTAAVNAAGFEVEVEAARASTVQQGP
jgi:hypothetical protein